MAQTTSDAPSRLVAFDPQVDRHPARRADHPDLADRLGSGLARLARRDDQPAALRGDERRAGADARPLMPPRRSARSRRASGSIVAPLSRAWRGADPRPGRAGAAAGRGRPVRTNVWLDPADGRVLDKAASDAGLVRVFHVLHGSLMVPGWGRTIVGWVGVFMFLSCLTGLWLWWPVTGSVRRGFRWKRQNSTNANLHHQMGFWIAMPLAMLSFTGFWISFPSVFASSRRASPARPAAAARPARPSRPPARQTAMTPDAALAAAPAPRDRAAGHRSPGRPTRRREWKIALRARGRPGRGRGDRRHRRGEAAAPAAPGDHRPADAPPARRHRHGPRLADRHLHRRDHPGPARGHRPRHVVAQPRLEGGAGARSARPAASRRSRRK